jgi:DNA-binding MarR family transcriptional regulator
MPKTTSEQRRNKADAVPGGVRWDPKHPWRTENIGRLLFVVFSEFEASVFDRFEREGDGGIRQFHFHLLRHVDYDAGTRLVELARRAGITKGAMGQLARECEGLGLVVIRDDPGDRRAKTVAFSARGRALMDRLGKIVERVEREIVNCIGARRFEELRATLSTLREEFAQRQPPRKRRRRAA